VGEIFVTVALGEPEHQTLLDPNAKPELRLAVDLVPVPDVPTNPKREKQSVTDYSSAEEYSEEEEEDVDWVAEAQNHGWVRPGSLGNWKEKALKKGWTKRVQKCFYSTGTECDFLAASTKCHAAVQVDIDLPDIEELHLSTAEGDEEEIMNSELFALFKHTEGRKGKSALDNGSSSEDFKSGKEEVAVPIDLIQKRSQSDEESSFESYGPIPVAKTVANDVKSQDSSEKISVSEEEEEDQSILKEVSEMKEKMRTHVGSILDGHSDGENSDVQSFAEDDFRPVDEESECSELQFTGSRKTSHSSGSGSQKLQPRDFKEEESMSGIIESNKSSSTSVQDEAAIPWVELKSSNVEAVESNSDEEKKPTNSVKNEGLNLDFDDLPSPEVTGKLRYSARVLTSVAEDKADSNEGSLKLTLNSDDHQENQGSDDEGSPVILPLKPEDQDQYSVHDLALDSTSESDSGGVF
jgi:hypothetical protein